jgi:hypothetical protein
MQMMRYDEQTVIVCPEAYLLLKSELTPYGIKVIKGDNNPSPIYPDNILYNAVMVNQHLIHLLKKTDSRIIQQINKDGWHTMPVKQGYSKCSILPIGDQAMITADKHISIKASSKGIDCLLIRPGFIGLNGYEYGFIGGAAGCMDEQVFLTGHLDNHPDKAEIIKFIKKHGKEIIYLTQKPAYDYGTIILLKRRNHEESIFS